MFILELHVFKRWKKEEKKKSRFCDR